MINRVTLLLFFAFSLNAFSQEKELFNADCNTATKIDFYINPNFIPSKSPLGAGQVDEIYSEKRNSNYYFEKEHNSAWYTFDLKHAGDLSFDIIPDLATDDYDFLLFKIEGDNFCNDILNHTILPFRTNIARNNPKESGMTGLSKNTSTLFQKPGIGNNYSASLQVNANERYVLVLDNVYGGSGNHKIHFNYERKSNLILVVRDAESARNIDASVLLRNNNDSIVWQLKKENRLSISVVDFAAKKNNLNVYAPGYLCKNVEVDRSELIGNLENIKTVDLQKLKAGNSFVLKKLNFHGNKATLVAGAEKSLDELFLLMKQNLSMKIKIDGHVNGCESIVDVNKLSFDRANTVKEFLINKGIEENRIATEGFGCSKMLYPNAETEVEQALNRRVEVNILSL